MGPVDGPEVFSETILHVKLYCRVRSQTLGLRACLVMLSVVPLTGPPASDCLYFSMSFALPT